MSPYAVFANRVEAGQALAEALKQKTLADPVILALPRGGVPVAAEIARALKAPLDLVLVRKIGVPFQEELAAAAVVDGAEPEIVVNEDVCLMANLSRDYIDEQAKLELAEIERRAKLYLGDRPRAQIKGRTAIVVDDGIATGVSMRAVIHAVRRKEPKAVIVAVPVAPPDTIDRLREDADEVVCLETPYPFYAIGLYYRDFHQVPDAEVMRILADLPAAGPRDTGPSNRVA